ncbi:family 43 glycosylhydrolase [Coprobacter secundus]|uniref:family 43 glycosylhydrolase n=1 Tax=Coprobacter secundus TaxID=1501392 RepID=UPI0022DFC7FB|nr:family 43 glycosylhydrolase [Coprobacter secundus]
MKNSILNYKTWLIIISLFSIQSIILTTPINAKKIPNGISILLDGDFPDPTIVKDGDNYYMTTSFGGFPCLMIWQSNDLLHWKRIDYALKTPVAGAVWAPELIKHNDTFYLYFPAGGHIYVMTATNPTGPWSKPQIIEGVSGIDPGHLVDKNGNRYLYIDNGRVVQLSSDGLSISGKEIKVYDGWKFSNNYGVECFCLESPKMLYRNGYYYIISAQGGTGGPATSHMASVARSKSPFGPFEDSPYNPLIKTFSPFETWRSKGHATIFEGPKEQWYAIYHGYENGHLPMGRKTLLEPVVWTQDGWIKSGIKNTKKAKNYFFTENTRPKNDDFSSGTLNKQWTFTNADTYNNYKLQNRCLTIMCKSGNINGLMLPMCDKNFEVQFKIIPDQNIETGLVLYYDKNYYAGMILKNGIISGIHKNKQPFGDKIPISDTSYFKLTILNYNVYISYSKDGKTWTSYPDAFDVSGYHTNILENFGSLKIAVIGNGNGKIQIDDFKYRTL